MTDKPKLIIEIPTTRRGIDNREAYRKFVEEGDKTPEPEPQTSTEHSVEGMIYVPSINLHFAKERTHLNLNWNQTHEALASEGKRMPTIPEFRNFLNYLRENPNQEHTEIYNEITQVKSPLRSEWIDAYFEKRKDGLYVLTQNKIKEEKLEDCLMKDKTPGINLDDWLEGKNVTNQGIPKSKIANGDLYYWYPRENCVAWFVANSDGAVLDCGWGPASAGSSLGVFAVSDADGNARGQKHGGVK